VLQCAAVCCSVLQKVVVCCNGLYLASFEVSVRHEFCVAACGSVWQRVAACGSVWQCVAVCCSVP